jgi:hypothetical protein
MDVHDLILLVRDCSFQHSQEFYFCHRNCLCRQGSWTICYAPRWRLSRSTLEQDLPRLVYLVFLSQTMLIYFFLAESVREPEILAILRPMIKRYALERLEGERFGDFTIRAGYIAPTTEGKLWYDRSGGEGENREGSSM